MQKAMYILGELRDSDITWMGRTGSRRTVEPGTVLIREGESIDAMYIVIDGRLEVVLGNDTRVATLGAGEIVGEMSLIEKRPPSASVVAVEESRVLAIPQDAIREMLKKDQAFAAGFYRALAVFLSDRLRATMGRFGYGNPAEQEDEAARLEEELELDEGVLDNVHLAGDRFRRLAGLLDGRQI